MTEPAPSTYAEWLPLLEQFASGDDSVLPLMQAGSVDWTRVVAERLTSRMVEALKTRLEAVSRQLQAALDRAAGNSFSVSQALLSARRRLEPLRATACLRCFPEEVQSYLAEQVRRFAEQTQESIESSAKRVRHDGGEILKAIRDNPLTLVGPPDVPDAQKVQQPPAPPRGRRVLI